MTVFKEDGSLTVKTHWLLVVLACLALSALLYIRMCKQERPHSQKYACITKNKIRPSHPTSAYFVFYILSNLYNVV
jgi:hypothetical protein